MGKGRTDWFMYTDNHSASTTTRCYINPLFYISTERIRFEEFISGLLFHNLKIIEVGLWDHLTLCRSAYISPTLTTFEFLNNFFIYTTCVYHFIWAHPIHKFLPSVCVSLCISPSFVTKHRSHNHILAQRRIVGRIVFYAVSFSSPTEPRDFSVCVCVVG
jgi:hypothetical protein